MRIAFALTVPLVGLLVAACHHAPEENVASRDAAAPTITTPLLSASGAASSAPSAADAGQNDLRLFCDDVYAADATRVLKKCLPRDQGIQRGLSRAASSLCSDDLNAAVGHGRVSFDHDAAKHCVEMLQGTEVPRMSDTDTIFMHFPCDRALLGLEDDGQPCRWSVECKDGLACVGYGVGVDGTCKKPPKAGEACSSQRFGTIINDEAAGMHHPACAAGAWCDGRTCQPLTAGGKACINSPSCANGLSCVMSKCAKPGAAGGACNHSADCKFGMWCNKPASGVGACEARRTEGAECPLPDACLGRCDAPKPADGGPVGVGRCVAVCGSG